MKKTAIIVLCLMAAISIAALSLTVFAAPARAGAYANAIVKGKRVNVRAMPNKSSQVVYQFPGGEFIVVTEKTIPAPGEYPWYRISYGNVSGWVYGQFLSFANAQINGTHVNARQGPGKNYPVVFQFPGWETVVATRVTVPEPGMYPWYLVHYGNMSGWVYGQFLNIR